jgi:predicted deacetylase
MGARFIYRMDDIAPCMDWEQFWKFINLFKEYNVKPLLGIVPDNKDPELAVGMENKDFWEIIRGLKANDIVEIAQHGYMHKVSETNAKGVLGAQYGFNSLSEFAGLSYETQYNMIKSGMEILRKAGLSTDIWMAPCHSFDRVTLAALKDLGFKFVTDGIALYPFTEDGLIFIPQQVWKPKHFPFGILTICLHINNADDKLFNDVKKHIMSGAEIISFSDIKEPPQGIFFGITNCVFNGIYVILRLLRRLFHSILKG